VVGGGNGGGGGGGGGVKLMSGGYVVVVVCCGSGCDCGCGCVSSCCNCYDCGIYCCWPPLSHVLGWQHPSAREKCVILREGAL